MKTLAAIIFCTGVILLVFLSGASNKGDRYLMTLSEVEIYQSVECIETCPEKVLVTIVPSNVKTKVLALLKGQRKVVARIEYQEQAGWFTVTKENAKLLDVPNGE